MKMNLNKIQTMCHNVAVILFSGWMSPLLSIYWIFFGKKIIYYILFSNKSKHELFRRGKDFILNGTPENAAAVAIAVTVDQSKNMEEKWRQEHKTFPL